MHPSSEHRLGVLRPARSTSSSETGKTRRPYRLSSVRPTNSLGGIGSESARCNSTLSVVGLNGVREAVHIDADVC